MRKQICDKCKKIIRPLDYPRVLINRSDYEDFDLCEKCYKAFKKWLNE